MAEDALNSFIATRRREAEEAEATRIADGRPVTYKMRLRIRVGHKVAVNVSVHTFVFAGRTVTLKAQEKEKLISEAEWLILTAAGFKSISAAFRYGHRLQALISINAVGARLAVDVGPDNRATSSTSVAVKEAAQSVGSLLIDSVHGVQVYEDKPNVRVMLFAGRASVLSPPERWFPDLTATARRYWKLSEKLRGAAYFINAALLHGEPLAKMALGIAAVEMLRQHKKWNAGQLAELDRLQICASIDSGLPPAEASEIWELIERAKSQRQTIAEQTAELLKGLGLASLIPEWKRLYKLRSKILHGYVSPTAPEVGEAVGLAMELCPIIVGAAIEQVLS